MCFKKNRSTPKPLPTVHHHIYDGSQQNSSENIEMTEAEDLADYLKPVRCSVYCQTGDPIYEDVDTKL